MVNIALSIRMFLIELSVFSAIIGCSFIGGFYRISLQKRGKQFPLLQKILVGVPILFLLSLNEYAGIAAILVMGSFALGRGVHLLYWGIRTTLKRSCPPYLHIAQFWRVCPSGILLISCSLFFIGLSVASHLYLGGVLWQEREHVERLKDFMAYEIAYKQLALQFTGENYFPYDLKERPASPYSIPITGLINPSNGTFTVYLIPVFPFFSTYCGDHTGAIRKIYRQGRLKIGDIRRIYEQQQTNICPEDNPLATRVELYDIEQMKQEILDKDQRIINFLKSMQTLAR